MEDTVVSARNERRKAATRRRILDAANALFAHKGYAATSMEDISEAADVGVRTIYLHFDSKASVMLAYFDAWVDAFVDAIIARPVDEPVGDAVTAALAALVSDGWADDRFGDTTAAHPVVEFIDDGSPEIAGHIMHSWMRAQDRLTADATERGTHPEGSLVPRARAAAVFAGWTTTMLVFRDAHRGGGLPADATGNGVGAELVRLIGQGL